MLPAKSPILNLTQSFSSRWTTGRPVTVAVTLLMAGICQAGGVRPWKGRLAPLYVCHGPTDRRDSFLGLQSS